MRKSLEVIQNSFLEASTERLVNIDIGVISWSRIVLQYFKAWYQNRGTFLA